MKAAELRDLAADELGVKERELTDQLFRMRSRKPWDPARGRREDSNPCAAISRASRRCCAR
jgi:hypothetical protein